RLGCRLAPQDEEVLGVLRNDPACGRRWRARSASRVRACNTHPHPPVAYATGPSLSHFVGEVAPLPSRLRERVASAKREPGEGLGYARARGRYDCASISVSVARYGSALSPASSIA